VHFYRNAKDDDFIPGLMHTTLGGYHVGDIEFVAAFDVVASKVGKPLYEAIYAHPNNTPVLNRADMPSGASPVVMAGPLMDGLGRYTMDGMEILNREMSNSHIIHVLRETGTHVVVNLMPVGSQKATEFYARCALEAGCGFVNCIPVFIASNDQWADEFFHRSLPVIGDDIKSQVGATITHRVLTRLFADRGVRLDKTYQLNFGGNMDFYNMLERDRLASKKVSKTSAVTRELEGSYDIEPANVHVAPSDYVPWLTDRKFCHIQMEGTTFGNLPLKLELKLEVWDSPNSAGVILDAVRCCKLAMDRRLSGAVLAPSAYFMKSPPYNLHDADALNELEKFINLVAS
jgi:myo-inositol-1-phosphate synthase